MRSLACQRAPHLFQARITGGDEAEGGVRVAWRVYPVASVVGSMECASPDCQRRRESEKVTSWVAVARQSYDVSPIDSLPPLVRDFLSFSIRSIATLRAPGHRRSACSICCRRVSGHHHSRWIIVAPKRQQRLAAYLVNELFRTVRWQQSHFALRLAAKLTCNLRCDT
jgi:hypothetical protein